MMRKVLSRDLFTETMNDIRECEEYAEKLNAFFRKNKVEGYIYQPDCAASCVRLLHDIFRAADDNNDIALFCYDLDFGRKWKKGMVTDTVDGKEIDIDLSTVDKLYDYLLSRMPPEMLLDSEDIDNEG